VYNKFQKYITTVFFTETLRKYPIAPFLDRACSRDWKFPDSSEQSDVTLPRGTATYIPLYGIHHDPEYYPDPERFDPERFTQENMAKRHPFTYLPFGGGPRICLGEFHKQTPRIFRSEF
jgi:cytochrome P450 family 6